MVFRFILRSLTVYLSSLITGAGKLENYVNYGWDCTKYIIAVIIILKDWGIPHHGNKLHRWVLRKEVLVSLLWPESSYPTNGKWWIFTVHPHLCAYNSTPTSCSDSVVFSFWRWLVSFYNCSFQHIMYRNLHVLNRMHLEFGPESICPHNSRKPMDFELKSRKNKWHGAENFNKQAATNQGSSVLAL